LQPRHETGDNAAVADRNLSRRELLGGAAATAAVLLGGEARARQDGWTRVLDFGAIGNGRGWPGWTTHGVANLRREGGRGMLEAGSDVFPCDPRPVAFAIDRRFKDGRVRAELAAGGAGGGVVARRVGPQTYYAAIYDTEQLALLLLRRDRDGLHELARSVALPPLGSFALSLRTEGTSPTTLTATLEGALPIEIMATDATPALQRSGDPGVLATARTLFPSEGPTAFPALGNIHLLPYGVQEGQVIIDSAVGEAVLAQIRERSTASFTRITISGTGSPGTTAPSVVAATTGRPLRHGSVLRVATDVPARVEFEIASKQDFRHSRIVRANGTNEFLGAFAKARGFRPGQTVHWRARLSRHGEVEVGPARRFRTLPSRKSGGRVRIAIGACASQFGPSFEELIGARPDLFLWQGDLNYPDTLGPLAQTVEGYAGIWRDFLANPVMAPLLERAMFAAQRDDHDYGLQDANSTNLVARGLRPWRALMERRLFYRFRAGAAEFWVLDQRRFKTDPTAPDDADKTLLGQRQREWLLRTLAHSTARFKVICSPCTLAPLSANERDGSWAAGFTAERDLILRHVEEHVAGRTVFITGDTHWTMVYERDGLFEARPCPLGIPTPNDITLTDPQVAENARAEPGVVYADDDRGYFALVDVEWANGSPRMTLGLVKDDGSTAFARSFG
jgi:phosphodiesterase/alkaline phosphatase D-like protein